MSHNDVKKLYTSNSFSNAAFLWEAAMIILYATCVSFNFPLAPSTADGSGQMGIRYAMFQDVHVMMAIGFGFLYTLLRRYAWSGVSINFLICAFAMQGMGGSLVTPPPRQPQLKPPVERHPGVRRRGVGKRR